MLRNQIEYLKKVGKEETFHRGRFRQLLTLIALKYFDSLRYCWDIDDWMEVLILVMIDLEVFHHLFSLIKCQKLRLT